MIDQSRMIYLIRHALPTFEGEGRRCIGRTDLPLSEVGRAQASAMGRWLESKGLTAIYSSPLQRALQTALMLGPRVICVPGLEEIDMGAWEGMRFDEIQRSYPEAYAERGRGIAHVPPPGGESFLQCGARAWTAFCGVLEESAGDIAIVAHRGVNRTLLCRMQGRDLSEVLSIPQPFASVNIIHKSENNFTVCDFAKADF